MVWIYRKIFFTEAKPEQMVDKFLLQTLLPFLKDTQADYRQWFYIRYYEGGYHLRLRFKAEETFAPALDRMIEDYADSPIFSESHPYEPELKKYGAAMEMIERHFQLSSEFALKILQLEQKEKIPRSLFALSFQKTLIELAYQSDEARATLLQSYCDYWLQWMDRESILAKLEENTERNRGTNSLMQKLEGNLLLKHWSNHLRELVANLHQLENAGNLSTGIDAFLREESVKQHDTGIAARPLSSLLIFPNLIHLLNNRLGLGIMQETQLSHLLLSTYEVNQHQSLLLQLEV